MIILVEIILMYQYMRERMNMKKEYVAPVIVGEEFSANEYIAACWGVGCSVDSANVYEQTHYTRSGRKQKTWWELGCSHATDHCGNSGNQVIFDDDDNGTADRMVEVGTDGLGDLTCTIYTDGSYSSTRSVSSVTKGETIYWTTASGEKVWHHVGTVYETVPGHPNRS